jgi:hypothetical protein
LNRWINRPRREARDLFELVLLPGLAALLPWSLAFRLLRRLARAISPYADATHAALEQASARGWVGDAAHWSLVRRVVTCTWPEPGPTPGLPAIWTCRASGRRRANRA